ncbi:MAG: hypothetical protein JW741_09155 [Sedimentisphaerales bacterium]|nr:hypothetical protein [Sedimentisphaerales bacterium]
MYDDKNIKRTRFKWKSRWLCAVLLVLIAGQAWAAEPDPFASAVPATPAAEGMDVNEPQVDFSEEGVMIKFIAFQKESTIRDGLRLLAALCKKNIVPSSQVSGELTVSRLYNVTFEQALDAVLGHGFKYQQDGDFVRVYTVDEYKKIKTDPERMTHKVITLYYITAEEAKKLVQPVLSDSAKIETSTAAQSSISTAGGTSGGGLSSQGGGDDPALNDMIVLFDYPENIEKAEAVIREIDSRPLQVLVEATIMSALLTEGMEFGVDWNFAGGVALDGTAATETIVTDMDIDRGSEATYPINTISDLAGDGTPIETFGFATQGGNGLRVGISCGDFRMFVSALESVTDVTILANTKILAVNKQEGSVLIGTNLGYRSSTTIGQGGVATSGSVEFLQTGTQLIFRPYIASDGYIRMDIYPKDSDASLNEDKVPTEKTTELKTNVIVKDGETVVIGGLFRDVLTSTRQQVPVLGNLPLVGTLFRGTTDASQREEVIILLTPHIIEEPSETNGEDRIDDIRLKREGAKKAMQAIDRSRLADDAYARGAKYYLEGDLEKAMYNLKIALMMRPTYLEALRLRERIIAETDPEEYKRIDSIIMEDVDGQEAENWIRR